MPQGSPEQTDIHVGRRIRIRRNAVGMTQVKLAEAIGITFQQIQKYEKGTNRVGASRLQAIADVLGVSVAYFFEGADAGRANGPEGLSKIVLPNLGDEFLADRRGIKIACLFADMPEWHRSLLLSLAEILHKFPSTKGE